MKTLNPAEWAKPKGYANGVAAEGRFVFVAGQIGWTAEANTIRCSEENSSPKS